MLYQDHFPIQPISNQQDFSLQNIHDEENSSEYVCLLENIVGIPLQDFSFAPMSFVSQVGAALESIVANISHVSQMSLPGVSRETYYPLDIEDDFSLFLDHSLMVPMNALNTISGVVSRVQSAIGVGAVSRISDVFLNVFDRILASEAYSRLEHAIRDHADGYMGVGHMYVLLSSQPMFVQDVYESGIDMTNRSRRLFEWFFTKKGYQKKSGSSDRVFDKKVFTPLNKPFRKDVLPFYSGHPDPVGAEDGDSLFLYSMDKNRYPLRYSYMSISESVVFIQVNRLFKDFYINTRVFEHKVNEFLQDIAFLIATYTLFIRQANIVDGSHYDESDDKDILSRVERLCLTAETIKSIGHAEGSATIMGLSKFDKTSSHSLEHSLLSLKESLRKCEFSAHVILSEEHFWKGFSGESSYVSLLEVGRMDIFDTLKKIEVVQGSVDELFSLASVLDIQHVSSTLKQLQYKLKLSA